MRQVVLSTGAPSKQLERRRTSQPAPAISPAPANRLRWRQRIGGSAILVALLALHPNLCADDLRVGAAMVRITPPPGTPMAGYYHERAADGVLDDLYARALVLEKDGVTAALVSLDLIGTLRPFVVEARRLVEQETGIPAGQVMISATHTHTGPVFARSGPRYERQGGRNALAVQYTNQLPRLIADAVKQAHAQRAPAGVQAAIGHEETIAFNRRYHLRDGTVGWNPGIKNPAVIKPAGPIDPAMPFVYFENNRREPIATYVNYAVHLDNVGGPRISADLPASLTQCLAAWKGPKHVTVYTTGTCGDINQINVQWEHSQQSPQFAARLGMILGGEVLRQWSNLRPVAAGPLCVRSELVKLPLAPVAAAEVQQARAALAAGLNDRSRLKFMEAVNAYKVLDVAERNGQPLEVEVQVITLGSDLAWVSLPGEIFVQLGLDLKQDSPFRQTMIAELANGSIGYIPNRRAYPQGAYEVVSARCAEGAGEMLVRSAVRQLTEIHAANLRPKSSGVAAQAGEHR